MYEGVIGGDSGGAFLVQDRFDTVLCGLNSRYYPRADFLAPVGAGTDITDLSSLRNVEFIRDNILDSQGRFKGECDEGPESLRDVDTDFDLSQTRAIHVESSPLARRPA